MVGNNPQIVVVGRRRGIHAGGDELFVPTQTLEFSDPRPKGSTRKAVLMEGLSRSASKFSPGRKWTVSSKWTTGNTTSSITNPETCEERDPKASYTSDRRKGVSLLYR